MTPVIRRATRQDIERYYDLDEVPYTITAIIGLIDEKPIGIGGLAHVNGLIFAFFDIKPEARRYRITILKSTLSIMERARALGYRYIFATCDKTEPGAEKLLARLGFKPLDDGENWRWDG